MSEVNQMKTRLRILTVCCTLVVTPLLFSAETDGATLRFQGESEATYIDEKGQTRPGDKSTFSLIRRGPAWQMTLAGPVAPDKPTILGDDGVTYYIFAKGSGGTCRMKDVLTRYEDTVNVFKTEEMYPKRHGGAPWLVFAGSRAMHKPAGEIFLGFAGSDVKKAFYEQVSDPKKNSFGPSRVAFFQKFGPKAHQRTLLAELVVLEWREQGAHVLPTSVEFRMFGNAQTKLNGFYRLFNISLDNRNDDAVVSKPDITKPTLIVDYRLPDSFEYVSSFWTTPAQALDLLKSGVPRIHHKPKKGHHNELIGTGVLLLFTISGPIVFKVVSEKRKSKLKGSIW